MRPLISFLSLITLTLCLSPSQAFAQGSGTDVGLELQVYPTGIIPGARAEFGLSQRDGLNLRIGYQYIRHRDLGVHQDERGSGAGFSLGYRRYFKDDRAGWFLGGRVDLWFNTLDWRDNIDMPNEINGTTKVTVLQPTVEGGYQFLLGKNENWVITPALAFGFEVNIATDGEPVGEGAILLGGVSVAYRIR